MEKKPKEGSRSGGRSREGSTLAPASTQKEDVGSELPSEDTRCNMHRFSLYETSTRFYLVGGDIVDRRFRILKIDRTTDSAQLSIAEDDIVYTKREMNQLLNAVDDGNKSSGGLKLRCSSWGLLGFVRFTGTYYMLLITKRSQVAVIGGHYIYQVDDSELVSLASPLSNRSKSTESEEARFIATLNNLDLSRSFYFSYSYDVTRTLQDNVTKFRKSIANQSRAACRQLYNSMFVWNHHLLEPAYDALRHPFDWCLPLIHGFVDQAALSVYGRTVHIALIARRSRFFAGARFLKRGANDSGFVANDVETEQIVSEMQTTSFHAPGPKPFANPNITSYVQHRGSIPLHWTQDNSGVSPKPGIELNLVDPFYGAAALHFNNLFERYGAPVYVLNLVKARERTPRESILLKEYANAIQYLNQSLPLNKKIKYRAWDMARASKSRDQDVIDTLESIAEEVLQSTGFFQNASPYGDPMKLQNGVARTNCIDCLDRTNAAQFVIGKRALGHQLHALGIIDGSSVEYDTDAVNLFTHMFHNHGDTIAIQYGGSHLVNTMETYRKVKQWTSHSRDMVETFKRYYNNSFIDRQRQEAYNLFLGNYSFIQGQPLLWDLSTDYYLHHVHPKFWKPHRRREYQHWYNPEFLEKDFDLEPCSPSTAAKANLTSFPDDYWLEYYRPLALSSFTKIFAYKMKSTLRYVPFKITKEERYDLSPFRVREGLEHHSPHKAMDRKEMIVGQEEHDAFEDVETDAPADQLSTKTRALPTWLQSHLKHPRSQASMASSPPPAILEAQVSTPAENQKQSAQQKLAAEIETLNQFYTNSLLPKMETSEALEYERYINHPLQLSLVVSADLPPSNTREAHDLESVPTVNAATTVDILDPDLADYEEFLHIGEDPLTVTEVDTSKKRYKAYRQWVKGKSLFRQRLET